LQGESLLICHPGCSEV